jgi:ubiquinone/menaquinone biosynthesis C-methylase UbiE
VNGERVQLIKTSDSAVRISLDDSTIDYLYCEGVLHHTSDPQATLKEFFRIMKPHSRGCIMVYNRNSLWVHLYTAYYKVILQGAFPGMTIEEAFSRNTDGESCPISRCYDSAEFGSMCRQAGFEVEYVGGYFSVLELDMLKQYGEIALRELRLAKEHREFLRNLTLDGRGFPIYRGKHAGIGGVYALSKK